MTNTIVITVVVAMTRRVDTLLTRRALNVLVRATILAAIDPSRTQIAQARAVHTLSATAALVGARNDR